VRSAWWSSERTIGTAGPEERTAERGDPAVDVRLALGGAGAVELEGEPVEGGCRLEAGADARLEPVERLGRERAAGGGVGPQDRHRDDLRLPRDDLEEATDLAHAREPLPDFRALVQAERAEVRELGGRRVEAVGLLGDVDQSEPHDRLRVLGETEPR
jgi:hypothetical protein